jgi:hypothetical protein
MKERYRIFRRESGIFYSFDTVTKQRHSLETTDRATARRIVHVKNEACQQPAINLQIAKAYLAAADPNFIKRDWGQVMAEFVKTKTGTNRTRSERAIMDHAFDSIRDLELIQTRSEHFLRVLESRKVSTNNYLSAPLARFDGAKENQDIEMRSARKDGENARCGCIH